MTINSLNMAELCLVKNSMFKAQKIKLFYYFTYGFLLIRLYGK